MDRKQRSVDRVREFHGNRLLAKQKYFKALILHDDVPISVKMNLLAASGSLIHKDKLFDNMLKEYFHLLPTMELISTCPLEAKVLAQLFEDLDTEEVRETEVIACIDDTSGGIHIFDVPSEQAVNSAHCNEEVEPSSLIIDGEEEELPIKNETMLIVPKVKMDEEFDHLVSNIEQLDIPAKSIIFNNLPCFSKLQYRMRAEELGFQSIRELYQPCKDQNALVIGNGEPWVHTTIHNDPVIMSILRTRYQNDISWFREPKCNVCNRAGVVTCPFHHGIDAIPSGCICQTLIWKYPKLLDETTLYMLSTVKRCSRVKPKRLFFVLKKRETSHAPPIMALIQDSSSE